jgi:ParB family chromosome partitioning protein
MSKEKKVLGRGISALISQNLGYEPELESGSSIKILNLGDIQPNPHQPRKDFQEKELKELCESIKEHGILQPIIVRQQGDFYQIIAGERRYQAAKLNDLKQIPAVIKDISDKEAFEIALVENIQRENLTAIEEAQAYERMIKEFNHTHDSLAKVIGKSRSFISNTLRLLSLPEEVKNLVVDGKISAGHARTLVTATDATKLAEKIVNDNWSVRKTEDEIKRRNRPNHRHQRLIRDGAYKYFEKDSALLEIEQMLSAELNTKVSINDTPEGGQVVIEFGALEELDGIIARLGGNKNIKFL